MLVAPSSGLFVSRRTKRLQNALVILATLLLTIWLLISSGKDAGESALGNQEFNFHPIPPYSRLAHCKRNRSGEINCPDIRRKGKTTLRQAQLVLTRMLRIFDLIAKKHGIRYWLNRGTLLGAVRHNGHVPFDSDVDIAIPKLDFEKFVKYGVKELPKDIFFQTEKTDVYWKVPFWSGLLAKLRDNESCYKYCIEKSCKHHDGLQLDFFVTDTDDGGNFVEVYSSPNWFLRRFIHGPILRKPEDIFPLTEVNFDGFSLPAPREWKNILKSLYGNFMKIPKNEPLGHVNTDPLRSCDKAWQ